MKRAIFLAVVVFLLYAFLFTGCTTNSGSTTELTDEDVSSIAAASLGAGAMSAMFSTTPDGTYSAGDLEESLVSGTLTVSNGTFTFTDCAFDVEDPKDGVADVTVGGSFSVEVDGSTTTITFNALTLTGTIPGASTTLNATITGSFTITETEFNVNIAVSGITDEACTVVLVMSVSGGEPQEVTSATINGTDYTDVFNNTLASLFQ